MREKLFKTLCCFSLLACSGCSLVLPEVSHQPVIRNPFPQLSHVAVAPFFNHSDEATVDGREIAMAYFAELQKTPGFEVVPVGVVEEAIIAHRINLSGPGEARRLAEILGVDAVVVGAITDYTAYYPPRCGLRVEWYTANPGYHEIPIGYGLPWNTPEEEYIPDSLVYESQMALARAQMTTQSPDCDNSTQTLPPPPGMPASAGSEEAQVDPFEESAVRLTQAEELPAGTAEPTPVEAAGPSNESNDANESIVSKNLFNTTGAMGPNWPDKSCFDPAFPQATKPQCVPFHGPVLSHTRIYRGTDPELTEALKSYVYFRDDARFGGWEAYLQRSDDFLRFCCHMHISEMLAARGGSHKTRLVWRWPDSR